MLNDPFFNTMERRFNGSFGGLFLPRPSDNEPQCTHVTTYTHNLPEVKLTPEECEVMRAQTGQAIRDIERGILYPNSDTRLDGEQPDQAPDINAAVEMMRNQARPSALVSSIIEIEDERMTTEETITWRRSWRERLFTRPWRPLSAMGTRTVTVPLQDVLLLSAAHGFSVMVGHPSVISKLHKEMGRYVDGKDL